MVKICPDTYPITDDLKYSQYFDKYPFSLSSFQKYAIESIVEGHHILVTAHTGSGKTLPAEFAIEYFASKGKKVIYTSPIKALSNQKFYEFTQKFPNISFGILTGDIKTNPEADVLIMTTEILMNTLYAKNKTPNNSMINSLPLTMFEMDFQNELACVVFDEIHYINDLDRGKVWEETIMMLPKHIQMVMLSATLDSPEKFADWCENRGSINELTDELTDELTEKKIVYLTTTYERVVPLTHYSFITCTQGLFKVLKNKELEKQIMKTTNTLHIIQDSKGNFNEQNYQTISKTLKIFNDKNHYVKRQHILNSVSKYMFENNMLPAICFVLSRKALEQCAKEITTDLLEDDTKIPYTIRRECEQIIRKLPNYNEYINLPEYLTMVSLLEKGIAIHHAGIIPILREMVELLFAKGYIKLLFATETFAVGINMPTKTVLFTDLNKFNGTNMRPFYSHEYTQMAGRAGRRGIDKVGHVIHLTNLFKNMDQITTKTILKGKPQTLVSKFKISYNLLLNLIDVGETDYSKYVKRSMIQNDIDKTTKSYETLINKTQNELDNLSIVLNNSKTPFEIVEEYIQLKDKRLVSINKHRKEVDRNILRIEDAYKTVITDVGPVLNYKKNKMELEQLINEQIITEKLLENNVSKVIELLEKDGYIISDNINKFKLTLKGHIATNIREIHCLVFTELILNNSLQHFEPKELVGILSCFTNISVQEENRTISPLSENSGVKECINSIYVMYQTQSNTEFKYSIDTGFDYSMHFDLIDYSIKWCECNNDLECKQLLQQISLEKDIFLGEFVKAILKINNIVSELEKIAELINDMSLLNTLKQIPQLTLKYVATNQSLYV
jgi:superfamily II RNA helicase